MTSFKKLIIGVAATALAITSITPAQAVINADLNVNGYYTSDGLVSTDPVLLPVPDDNKINATDALQVVVADLSAETFVNVVATNAYIVSTLDSVANPVTANSGTTTFKEAAGADSSVDFYVYTKADTVGSIAVTVGGDTITYFVQGVAGELKTLSVTAPVNGIGEKTVKFTAVGKDVFNNLTDAEVNLIVNVNGIVSTDYVDTNTEYTVTLPESGSVILSVYADGVTQATATIAARNLLTELAGKDVEIAELKAQIATLQAENAGLKTKFNNLARKWNKKFPKHRVLAVK